MKKNIYVGFLVLTIAGSGMQGQIIVDVTSMHTFYFKNAKVAFGFLYWLSLLILWLVVVVEWKANQCSNNWMSCPFSLSMVKCLLVAASPSLCLSGECQSWVYKSVTTAFDSHKIFQQLFKIFTFSTRNVDSLPENSHSCRITSRKKLIANEGGF